MCVCVCVRVGVCVSTVGRLLCEDGGRAGSTVAVGSPGALGSRGRPHAQHERAAARAGLHRQAWRADERVAQRVARAEAEVERGPAAAAQRRAHRGAAAHGVDGRARVRHNARVFHHVQPAPGHATLARHPGDRGLAAPACRWPG